MVWNGHGFLKKTWNNQQKGWEEWFKCFFFGWSFFAFYAVNAFYAQQFFFFRYDEPIKIMQPFSIETIYMKGIYDDTFDK